MKNLNLSSSQFLYLKQLLSEREAILKFKKERLNFIDASLSFISDDEIVMIDSIFKSF